MQLKPCSYGLRLLTWQSRQAFDDCPEWRWTEKEQMHLNTSCMLATPGLDLMDERDFTFVQPVGFAGEPTWKAQSVQGAGLGSRQLSRARLGIDYGWLQCLAEKEKWLSFVHHVEAETQGATVEAHFGSSSALVHALGRERSPGGGFLMESIQTQGWT